jgi:mannose-6-phosphate isomerase
MKASPFGLLRFEEAYFERIWGGRKLEGILGKKPPVEKTIGEAWLISDHLQHESVVAEGPQAGRTLRALLQENPEALLGERAQPTHYGRFPLLLKLLDAADPLSVQVHPDDATAQRLGEPDTGKTEMWYVIDADPGAELICGLDPALRRDDLLKRLQEGSIETALPRFHAPAGTAAFVAAGTVHAIGGGLLLAEIQQNSDLTYRLYDYNRLDTTGRPRDLHLDKATAAIRFGAHHGGPAQPLRFLRDGANASFLAACRYFAAEIIDVQGHFKRPLPRDSFHILLALSDGLAFDAGGVTARMRKGEAALTPGALDAYTVSGDGAFLDYYVPGLRRDVAIPLSDAGHSPEAIIRLGGAPEYSDLAVLF